VGSAATHPVESIRVVEVEKAMVPAARLFAEHNDNVLDDPRVELSINDARNELEFSSRTYDVIISEPSNPWMAGISNLFTREFFELARSRPKKHLTSATKSNGIMHTMPFWDERFRAIAEEYPDVRADQYHVDILAANFVLHPDWFDVVVGSNLFGDILSDLGPAVAGTIGIAPSANINPEGEYPSMFEPVHGSAPDIAGKGIANPIGQIWSGAMMLEHLGEVEAAQAVERAIETVLEDGGVLTRDMGGKARTQELGAAVESVVRGG